MTEYEFTLKFAIPEAVDAEQLEDRLFEGGCDDALVGVGRPGRLGLSFAREARHAVTAIGSAIRDVQAAVPKARFIEVDPDLVGLSDIAALSGCSRQNMRKLVQTYRDSFPLPVHEGQSALWHLADVLDWFDERLQRSTDRTLRELAQVSMTLNAQREVRRLEGVSPDWLAVLDEAAEPPATHRPE